MSVIELTRQLGAAIQQDERYKQYEEARKANEADVALNDLIGKINLIQMNYQQEASKGEEADESKMEQYGKEFEEAYDSIISADNLAELNEALKKLAEELGIGEITLRDIVKELEKPARDPREDMPKPILRSDVLEMKDLTPGMVLKGTVRNVIDFGAFVDIGIKQIGDLLAAIKLAGCNTQVDSVAKRSAHSSNKILGVGMNRADLHVVNPRDHLQIIGV